MVNAVKASFATGSPCYILNIRHARTIEIVGIAQGSGHHAFFVDMQHSTISADQTAEICMAGLYAGLTPMVRLPAFNRATCENMLEAGALGIIVPSVESAAEAREIAACCAFPPAGGRSPVIAGPTTRFKPPRQAEDRRRLAAETVVLAMLESEAGIAAAEEIAAVPGIDALMIGTNDLTSSLGLHAEYEHPKIKGLYAHAIAAAKKHGKHLVVAGIRDPEIVARYVADGAAHCYVTGTDTALLAAGAEAQVNRFRAIDKA